MDYMKLISTHWCKFWYKLLRSIFSTGTQTFDFIKRYVIRKLTYKVEYIDQINGGLIIWKPEKKIF